MLKILDWFLALSKRCSRQTLRNWGKGLEGHFQTLWIWFWRKLMRGTVLKTGEPQRLIRRNVRTQLGYIFSDLHVKYWMNIGPLLWPDVHIAWFHTISLGRWNNLMSTGNHIIPNILIVSLSNIIFTGLMSFTQQGLPLFCQTSVLAQAWTEWITARIGPSSTLGNCLENNGRNCTSFMRWISWCSDMTLHHSCNVMLCTFHEHDVRVF